MTAYVEQLHRSEKRVNLIEGSLQIVRLLLSNDQAHRRGLTSFVDLASDVLLVRIFHHDLLFAPCRHVAELLFSTMLSFNDHEKCNAHTKAGAQRTVRKVTEFFVDAYRVGRRADTCRCLFRQLSKCRQAVT